MQKSLHVCLVHVRYKGRSHRYFYKLCGDGLEITVVSTTKSPKLAPCLFKSVPAGRLVKRLTTNSSAKPPFSRQTVSLFCYDSLISNSPFARTERTVRYGRAMLVKNKMFALLVWMIKKDENPSDFRL